MPSAEPFNRAGSPVTQTLGLRHRIQCRQFPIQENRAARSQSNFPFLLLRCAGKRARSKRIIPDSMSVSGSAANSPQRRLCRCARARMNLLRQQSFPVPALSQISTVDSARRHAVRHLEGMGAISAERGSFGRIGPSVVKRRLQGHHFPLSESGEFHQSLPTRWEQLFQFETLHQVVGQRPSCSASTAVFGRCPVPRPSAPALSLPCSRIRRRTIAHPGQAARTSSNPRSGARGEAAFSRRFGRTASAIRYLASSALRSRILPPVRHPQSRWSSIIFPLHPCFPASLRLASSNGQRHTESRPCPLFAGPTQSIARRIPPPASPQSPNPIQFPAT